SFVRVVTEASRGQSPPNRDSATQLVNYLVQQNELDEATQSAWMRSFDHFYGSGGASGPKMDPRAAQDLAAGVIDSYHAYQIKEARKQIEDVHGYVRTLAGFRRGETALLDLTGDAAMAKSYPRTHEGYAAFTAAWNAQVEQLLEIARTLENSPVERYVTRQGLQAYCDQLLANAEAAADAYPALQQQTAGSS